MSVAVHNTDEIVCQGALVEALPETTGKREAIVDLICEGFGNRRDNHYYSAALLAECAPMFAGVKMYANHLDPATAKKLAGMPRDIREIVAIVKESWVDTNDQGKAVVRARVKIAQPWLWELVSTDPDLVAVSIDARGSSRTGMVEGKQARIVESIMSVKSVDWVSEAGAGGRVIALIEAQMKAEDDEKASDEPDADGDKKDIVAKKADETDTPAPGENPDGKTKPKPKTKKPDGAKRDDWSEDDMKKSAAEHGVAYQEADAATIADRIAERLRESLIAEDDATTTAAEASAAEVEAATEVVEGEITSSVGAEKHPLATAPDNKGEFPDVPNPQSMKPAGSPDMPAGQWGPEWMAMFKDQWTGGQEIPDLHGAAVPDKTEEHPQPDIPVGAEGSFKSLWSQLPSEVTRHIESAARHLAAERLGDAVREAVTAARGEYDRKLALVEASADRRVEQVEQRFLAASIIESTKGLTEASRNALKGDFYDAFYEADTAEDGTVTPGSTHLTEAVRAAVSTRLAEVKGYQRAKVSGAGATQLSEASTSEKSTTSAPKHAPVDEQIEKRLA
jgi:hypothetical protein